MKNNTRDLFIETASTLFANKGYHATGISEILKKSQAPKGSLYYHFPQGKEQLALEALKKTAHFIYELINTEFNQYADPIKALQEHLYSLAKRLEKDLFQPSISISLIALETFASNEALRKECADIFAHMQDIFLQNFLKITDNHQYANFLAMTAVVIIEGTITLSLTQKSTQPLYDLADNLPILFNLQEK